LDHCLQQATAFDPWTWRTFGGVPQEDLAAVALFLAGVDWYGHQTELRMLASQLAPWGGGRLSALVRATGFDCGRFSALMKSRMLHARCLS
jgi:hypothetical protein